MDEVLKAIADLKSDFGTRLTTLEEAAKPKVDVIETKDEDILEIAEALAASTLSTEGRKRVLDLHRANKKPLAELIEAEEAYVKVATESTAETEGVEEVEESANTNTEVERKLPSRWTIKKDN